MRLFVAIDLPKKIKTELGQIHSHIRDARWVAPENMHLTLKFLGEIRGQQYSQVVHFLEEISVIPFDVKPKGVGYFASRDMAKVLWAGLEPCEQLEELAKKVRNLLSNFGEDVRQNFHPHITLARLNNVPVEEVVPFLQKYSLFSAESFEVESFSLYSSGLTPLGPQYTKEAEFELM